MLSSVAHVLGVIGIPRIHASPKALGLVSEICEGAVDYRRPDRSSSRELGFREQGHGGEMKSSLWAPLTWSIGPFKLRAIRE